MITEAVIGVPTNGIVAAVGVLNSPPTITGAVTSQAITDKSTTTPFSGVTISDPDSGQTQTVTVTLSSSANGRLSNLGSGTYNSVTGIYTVGGSASAVTAAVCALVFTPTANQVAPSSSVTTTFTMVVNDGVAAAVSNNNTSVVATSVNDAPTVSGTKAVLSITEKQAIQPFSSVIIADPDTGQVETVTISLSNSSLGSLSSSVGLGGAYDPTSGVYKVSGTVTQVNSFLQNLVFTPNDSASWHAYNYRELLTYPMTGYYFGLDGDGFAASNGTMLFSDSSSTGTKLLVLSNGGVNNAPSFQTVATLPFGLANDPYMAKSGDIFYFEKSSSTDSGWLLKELPLTSGAYPSSPKTLLISTNYGFPSLPFEDVYGNLFFASSNSNGTTFYELKKSGTGYESSPTIINSFSSSEFVVSIGVDKNNNFFYGLQSATGMKCYEILRNLNGTYTQPLDLGINVSVPAFDYVARTMDSDGNLFFSTISGQFSTGFSVKVLEYAKSSTGYPTTPLVIANINFAPNTLIGNLDNDSSGNLFLAYKTYQNAADASPYEWTSDSILEIPKTVKGYSSPITITHDSHIGGIDTNGNLVGVKGLNSTVSPFGSQSGPQVVYVLTPDPNAVVVTENFLISISDGTATITDNTASAIITASSSVNHAPTISGTAASQATTDQVTKSPFSGVMIADPDVGQIETVTVALSNPLNGRLSNLGSGAYNSATGVYTIAGSASAVTAAVDALVFTPTANQVAPGSAVTTTFTIAANDGIAAAVSNNITSVVATSVNDVPTISGTKAGLSITDKQTLQPFSSVVIADPDVGQTETVTVSLSNASHGVLSNLGPGSFDPIAGTFSVSGSVATVNSAINGLLFTPNSKVPEFNNYSKVLLNSAASLGETKSGSVFFSVESETGSGDVVYSVSNGLATAIATVSDPSTFYNISFDAAGNMFYHENFSGFTTIREILKTPDGFMANSKVLVTLAGEVATNGPIIDEKGNVLYASGNSLYELPSVGGTYPGPVLSIATYSDQITDPLLTKDGDLLFGVFRNQKLNLFKSQISSDGKYSSPIDLGIAITASGVRIHAVVDPFGDVLIAANEWSNTGPVSGKIYKLHKGSSGYSMSEVYSSTTVGLLQTDLRGNIIELIDHYSGNQFSFEEFAMIAKTATGYSSSPVTIAKVSQFIHGWLIDSSGNIIYTTGDDYSPGQVVELSLGVGNGSIGTNFSISVSDGLAKTTDDSASVTTNYSSSGNHAPTITSAATATTPENNPTSTAVYTVTATDPDANTTLTYSISPGGDAGLFNINSSTGAVTFKASPDFEAPVDAGKNNVYDITVSASDSSLFTDKAVAITVSDVPDSSVANLHGINFFWKANASGQHALLSGVNVSATGGTQPVEGANAPIQLKNVIWDATGHATVDVYAHVTTAVDSVQINLGLGSATNASFSSALTSDWTLLGNPSGGEYVIGGYSVTPLVTGDIKLGTLAFDTGSAAQMHLAVDAGSSLGSSTVTGSQGTIMATPYGMTLGHSTTGADGAYTISPLDPGTYALTASRSTSDIGNAITSADALAALKIAVGMNPNPSSGSSQLALSPFQIIAADVNADGRVTSADALGILKIAVRMSTAATPQWMFVDEIRDLSGLSRTNATWDHNISVRVAGDTTDNLAGVLTGDVNGSWTPPTGTQYVETTDPNHFTNLYNTLHIPLSEWGISGQAQSVTVAQYLALVASGTPPNAADIVTLLDTGANIAALSGIQIAALATNGIDMVDANDNALILSAAQSQALGAVALKVGDPLTIADTAANILLAANSVGVAKATSVRLTGANSVTATEAATLSIKPNLSLGAGATLNVADSAANVGSKIDILQAMLLANNLTSISLVGTPTVINITEAQLVADAAVLGKITTSFTITATGVISASAAVGLPSSLTSKLTSGLAVSDSAANVASNLDALQSLAVSGKLASILLTDQGRPVLNISEAQKISDALALSKITSSYDFGAVSTVASARLTLDGYYEVALDANGNLTAVNTAVGATDLVGSVNINTTQVLNVYKGTATSPAVIFSFPKQSFLKVAAGTWQTDYNGLVDTHSGVDVAKGSDDATNGYFVAELEPQWGNFLPPNAQQLALNLANAVDVAAFDIAVKQIKSANIDVSLSYHSKSSADVSLDGVAGNVDIPLTYASPSAGAAFIPLSGVVPARINNIEINQKFISIMPGIGFAHSDGGQAPTQGQVQLTGNESSTNGRLEAVLSLSRTSTTAALQTMIQNLVSATTVAAFDAAMNQLSRSGVGVSFEYYYKNKLDINGDGILDNHVFLQLQYQPPAAGAATIKLVDGQSWGSVSGGVLTQSFLHVGAGTFIASADNDYVFYNATSFDTATNGRFTYKLQGSGGVYSQYADQAPLTSVQFGLIPALRDANTVSAFTGAVQALNAAGVQVSFNYETTSPTGTASAPNGCASFSDLDIENLTFATPAAGAATINLAQSTVPFFADVLPQTFLLVVQGVAGTYGLPYGVSGSYVASGADSNSNGYFSAYFTPKTQTSLPSNFQQLESSLVTANSVSGFDAAYKALVAAGVTTQFSYQSDTARDINGDGVLDRDVRFGLSYVSPAAGASNVIFSVTPPAVAAAASTFVAASASIVSESASAQTSLAITAQQSSLWSTLTASPI